MLPPKVFTDGVGIVVELVPLKGAGGGEAHALLRISGLPSVVSGVTFLSKRSSPKDPDAWTVPLDGVIAFVLQIQQTRDGSFEYQLLLPHEGGPKIKLSEKPTASKFVDVDELIADYRSHLHDGSLKRLSEFDRDYARSSLLKGIEKGRSHFSKACGKSIDVSMDVSSLSTRQEFAEAYFCRVAISGLAELCKMGVVAKTKISTEIEHVRCHPDDKVELRYEAESQTLDVAADDRSPRARRSRHLLLRRQQEEGAGRTRLSRL